MNSRIMYGMGMGGSFGTLLVSIISFPPLPYLVFCLQVLMLDWIDKLEKEVEANDWKSGGRALTDQVFYNPPEEEVQEGKKGWEGGEFRLGGGPAAAVKIVSGGSTAEGSQPSMREVLAKAAEERMRRQAAAAAGKQKA